MNKLILFSAIALSLATVSCRKERTCECTQTDTTVTTFNSGGSISDTDVTTSKVTAEKQRKKFFRVHYGCYSSTSTRTDASNNYTEVRTSTNDCTLK